MKPAKRDAAKASEDEPREIWEARLYAGPDSFSRIGWLLAPDGDPARAIGIVFTDEEGDASGIELARMLLWQPWRMEQPRFFGLDLRTGPPPPWLAWLRVVPVDDMGNADEEQNRPLVPAAAGRK